MLSRWGGRPGVGGGFDSSHCPVVGTFDRFNGLSSDILLTFSCYFDNPQVPWGGSVLQRPPPPPPPSSLTLIGALGATVHLLFDLIYDFDYGLSNTNVLIHEILQICLTWHY